MSLAVAASATPIGLRAVVAALLIAIGATLATIGWRGWRGTLPRNRFVGVRTAATLRSDEAFAVANKVAALPILLAGAVLAVGGLLAATLMGAPTLVTVVVIAVVGACAIAVAGGLLGHRAALAIPNEPAAGSASCGGSCASCALGCRA